MIATTPPRYCVPRRLLLLLGVGLLATSFATGCTSDKAKAKKSITEAVTTCRKAKADGPFYKVKLFGDKTDEILKATCDKKITKFKMTSEVSAEAFTGPVRWETRIAEGSGVWTLYSAEWPDLERAKKAITDDDKSEERLTYAAKNLAEAQKQMPNSAWIRLRRLEALLDLRMKKRKHDSPNPISIGKDAQKQYDETLAWAKKNDDLDTQVEAQYLVADHLRHYLSRIDMVLSSDSSSDDWLINAAKASDKDGDHKKAEEYRQQLEKNREQRIKTQEIFTKRRVQTKDALCKQLAKLSPAGVQDADLQKRVVGVKSAVDCMKKAADKVAADGE